MKLFIIKKMFFNLYKYCLVLKKKIEKYNALIFQIIDQ